MNMVFVDGHGRFVSENIDYWIYVQLMTPYSDRALANVLRKTPAPREFYQSLPGDY